MSIGAAVRITSPDAGKVISAASQRAQQRGEKCFVISILRSVAEKRTDEEDQLAAHNLNLIMARNAAPVMQESDDVARGIISAARFFGVDVLFIGNPKRRPLGRSVPEKLLRLAPPFEIVVINRE